MSQTPPAGLPALVSLPSAVPAPQGLYDGRHEHDACGVAFVATLYGLGLANLVFLPLSGKIRAQVDSELRFRRLYLDGLLAISRKESPHTIETRLAGDVRERSAELLG